MNGDTDYETKSDDLSYKDISDTIEDTRVEEPPLATANPDTLNIAPDGNPKDAAKNAGVDTVTPPEPVSPSADVIPAEQINQGIPGVVAGSANEAPENKKQA